MNCPCQPEPCASVLRSKTGPTARSSAGARALRLPRSCLSATASPNNWCWACLYMLLCFAALPTEAVAAAEPHGHVAATPRRMASHDDGQCVLPALQGRCRKSPLPAWAKPACRSLTVSRKTLGPDHHGMRRVRSERVQSCINEPVCEDLADRFDDASKAQLFDEIRSSDQETLVQRAVAAGFDVKSGGRPDWRTARADPLAAAPVRALKKTDTASGRTASKFSCFRI